jgi:hypothetical protein
MPPLLSRLGSRCLGAKSKTGKRQAQIEGLGKTMQLEWVADSDFRFFPTQEDELFGYVLHPVDLATNKAPAAADQREPRDIMDLVTIHESILPLGAVICAAVGRFPGLSPEEVLAETTRHGRFTVEEFRVLATGRPLDVSDVHRRVRNMIEDAERFISTIAGDDVVFVFLDGAKPDSKIRGVQFYELTFLVAFDKKYQGREKSAPMILRSAYNRLKKRFGQRSPRKPGPVDPNLAETPLGGRAVTLTCSDGKERS